MTNDSRTHPIDVFEVERSSTEVHAGAVLTLRCTVACSRACDLSGRPVLIRGDDGAPVASVTLDRFDGKVNTTSEFSVPSPTTVGEHTWWAVLPAAEAGKALHEETSAPFSVTVTAHTVHMNVWGVPSAIAAGETFSAMVGAKCPCGWSLAGRHVDLYDHEGNRRAQGTLGAEPWPGTAALHFAEVRLEAPDAEGSYRWTARLPESDSEIPVREASATFGIRFTRPAECRVTVQAFDKDKQAPIEGARVVIHPYRAVTDENGVAEVRVPKGEYKVFVSGSRYVPVRTELEVTEDVTTRAELTWEPDIEHFEQHY